MIDDRVHRLYIFIVMKRVYESGSQKRAKKRKAEEAAKVGARTLFQCGIRYPETNSTKNTNAYENRRNLACKTGCPTFPTF